MNAAPTRLNLRLVEFEENRRTLTGSFITSEIFEKEQSSRLSDVITRRIPGLKVSPIGTCVSSAALMSGRQKGCFVQVIVDGLVQYQQGLDRSRANKPGEPTEKVLYDINELPTASIAGIEFYTMSNTPLRYRGIGSNCGTVVIWTKG